LSSKLAGLRCAAVRLLARREHSELELQQKLAERGFDAADIQTILTALISENLLSNNRFTENYLFARRQKGYGPLRIRAELAQRGISEDVIEHHLNITDNAWFAQAKKAWQKHFKGSLPSDFKIRARQMRFLQHRGFMPEHIKLIFRSGNDDA
jgi:regulatory protein